MFAGFLQEMKLFSKKLAEKNPCKNPARNMLAFTFRFLYLLQTTQEQLFSKG